ncbi:serine protease gd-like [Copidosoma floridanum]|uniref:serine protease gd-like n=1 Tax=Copidosoma floridanum TaxID=29053 RepID=UPI0006C983B7|nr:serine protease gd-like [Copidosoma floridanum]
MKAYYIRDRKNGMSTMSSNACTFRDLQAACQKGQLARMKRLAEEHDTRVGLDPLHRHATTEYFTQLSKMRYTPRGLEIFLQLLQFFMISQCQCPEYFRYFRNETTKKIMGIVEIPSPPYGVPLHLRVTINVATILPTKYTGHLELAQSRDQTIKSLQQGLPIFYKLHFPVQTPMPVVTNILLNGMEYCSGSPAVGPAVTSINFEHSLYPPRVIIPLTDELMQYLSSESTPTSLTTQIFPTTFPQTTSSTQRTIVPSTSQQPSTTPKRFTTAKTPQGLFQLLHPTKPKVNFECGLNSEEDPSLGEVKSLTWPWIAAIFHYGIYFLCTGILVSRQHVLTVAHCLKDIHPYLLSVSLGRRSTSSYDDVDGSVDIEVVGVKLHPDYSNFESADSDLAVITMADPVNLTPSIRPICLWMGNKDLNRVVDMDGYAIGWGSGGKRQSDFYRTSKVSIVSQKDCRRKSGFGDVTSDRTFCAISKDEEGFCKDSSGSGLILYSKLHKRYHLRGMVSLSMQNVDTGACDSEEFVVYVDVAGYLPWIRQQIS